MAIEKRTGLLYELLIRGNFGASHQAPNSLGNFEGGHLVEAEAVVDTETGEVLNYKPGNAQPITQERATAYFGEQFANFNASYLSEQAEKAAALDQVDSLRTELAGALDENAILKQRIGDAVTAVSNLQSQVLAGEAASADLQSKLSAALAQVEALRQASALGEA